MLNYVHGDFHHRESRSSLAPRLHVRTTVYVPNVTGYKHRSAAREFATILHGDCLRKYELHCGSRTDEDAASSDSTRPHLSRLRSRRALRLHAASLNRHITSVRLSRRKCNTQRRGSSARPRACARRSNLSADRRSSFQHSRSIDNDVLVNPPCEGSTHWISFGDLTRRFYV